MSVDLAVGSNRKKFRVVLNMGTHFSVSKFHFGKLLLIVRIFCLVLRIRDRTECVSMLNFVDLMILDTSTLNSPRTRAPPLPPHGEEMSRWRYYRPRFLHPRYFGPNPFDEQEADNADHPPAFYRSESSS